LQRPISTLSLIIKTLVGRNQKYQTDQFILQHNISCTVSPIGKREFERPRPFEILGERVAFIGILLKRLKFAQYALSKSLITLDVLLGSPCRSDIKAVVSHLLVETDALVARKLAKASRATFSVFSHCMAL